MDWLVAWQEACCSCEDLDADGRKDQTVLQLNNLLMSL